MKLHTRLYFFLFGFSLLPEIFFGQQVFPYQKPVQELASPFMSAADDAFIFSNDGKRLVHTRSIKYPAVSDISSIPIQVAGLYLNAKNFSSLSQGYISSFTVTDALTGQDIAIKDLPGNLRVDNLTWSSDGKKLAFTQSTPEQVDLYVIDLSQRRAVKINRQPLHIAQGKAYQWMPDHSLLYKTILQHASNAPQKNLNPAGAFVSDTRKDPPVAGQYTGNLQTGFEQQTFEFYMTSQLVHNKDGKEVRVGEPSLYTDFSLSPDGNYILCSILKKSFSTSLNFLEFPSEVKILSSTGKPVRQLVEMTVSGFQKRPRLFEWRPDLPSTITWVQPVDTGSQKGKGLSSVYYSLQAPFVQQPGILFKTSMPLVSVTWSKSGLALVTEIDRVKGISKTGLYRKNSNGLDKLYEHKIVDFANRTGMPITVSDANGRSILLTSASGKEIFINNGLGNTASGQVPFLARLDLDTKALHFTWKGENKKEYVLQVIEPENLLSVVRKNRETGGYEYSLRQMTGPFRKNQLLATGQLHAPFDSSTAQVIQYKRSDGVTLAGTLFLPKGYEPAKHGSLPLFIWSYPRRFYTRDEYSPEKTTEKKQGLRIDTWEAPQLFVARGYAVFEAGMPVIPDSNENANDHFIEQVVMNAEAAINKLSQDGIADPQRVLVGGHSYGGGMTALLLAYTDLFKAGIAMSGDYDHFQVPFGFQDETRNYWQAKEVYDKTSAIRYANKIKTPLLLIHGTHDQVSGTSPTQSENLFNAIRGTGGTVRYVRLPYESHGYQAKENILHLLWEMDQWMDKYVKNAKTN